VGFCGDALKRYKGEKSKWQRFGKNELRRVNPDKSRTD